MRARLLSAATVAACLIPASPAAAGDPIMPLSQVSAGMQCTAYSVVRGTTSSSFDIEIVDVVDGETGSEGPRIMFEASGAAIAGTNSLIDVRVVRDGEAKLPPGAEPRLAHHPRDERRRPGVGPPADAPRSAPFEILIVDHADGVGRHGPIAADGRRDAHRFLCRHPAGL